MNKGSGDTDLIILVVLFLLVFVAYHAYYLFTAPTIYIGLWGEDGSPEESFMSLAVSVITFALIFFFSRKKEK